MSVPSSASLESILQLAGKKLLLARQRELGVVDGPADTDEIYRVLSQN